MDKTVIIILVASVGGVVALGTLVYVLLSSRGTKRRSLGHLMGAGSSASQLSPGMRQGRGELGVDDIKEKAGRAEVKLQEQSTGRKLFRAGYFSDRDRKNFRTFQIVSFVVSPILFFFILLIISAKPLLLVLGAGIGFIIGVVLPGAWLDRKIAHREEEIMYFLPLVIEQVSIGVSSALDIGPCVNQIISMADERDSHNPVTEMLVHTERLIRSGLNLEDALIEVGDASGMSEVKHAFMFLAQCSKYGGEVSKQLQELADAVMTQRQVSVEGRIAALPVKATGPLTAVFAGFFGLIFSGLLVRIMTAFGG